MADGYRTNDRRVIPWLLVGLLVIFGGAYAAVYAYTADRLPDGTEVEGIDIGGMRPTEARHTLADELGARAAKPLVVSAVGQRAAIRPAAAGLGVDVRATVERVRTEPSWEPRRIWDWFAGGEDHAAVITVDRTALARAVARFAGRVDDPAVEGAVRFDRDGARARYPDAGTVVRPAAAASALQAAFRDLDGPDAVVALPTRTALPRVGTAEVSRAMDAFANPALSGSVVLRFDGRTARIRPEAYLPALSMRRVGARLRPAADPRLLEARLRPAILRLIRPGRHATAPVGDARAPTVHARRLSRRLLAALTRDGRARSVDLDGVVEPAPPGRAPADVTTAEARAP